MTVADVEYSYGEVGHDPPVHAVAGSWHGPAETTRSAAVNISLCGKRLARMRRRPPDMDDLCRKCEELMRNPVRKPRPDTELPLNDAAQQDYEVLHVPLRLLFVDETAGLQRVEQRAWSKKIAAGFSWTQFNRNPPKVSVRADGRYHIMDGQHEVAAARLVGHDPDAVVRVHAWRGLTREQEAEIFVTTNRDRHAVKPLDLFIANVTRGDAESLELDLLLNSHGWRAGSAGREGNFAAVTTLRRFYRTGGLPLCEKIVSTITAAWNHHPDGVNRTIVSAIGAFYQAYPAAEVDRLAQVLKRNWTPGDIHVWAHERSWQKLAIARLQDRYDSGLRDPKRRLG